MLPTINGKSFLECSEADFKEIINDSVYRENEYIDYKEFFSIDNYPKGQERDKAIAEFRSDVCSFANADGGFLIYGIKESHGIPSDLIGIDIRNKNCDRFELNAKNYLQMIQPRTPNCKFHFIEMENGKILVVIFVKHDAFAPYIHLENNKDYRIYKRAGNAKTVISHSELKRMFTQSVDLETNIQNYRRERIDYYCEVSKDNDGLIKPFLLFHLIPDTFIDSSYNLNLLVLEKKQHCRFGDVFLSTGCTSGFVSNVDGLRFPSTISKDECRLNNNGICEVYYLLDDYIYTDKHTTGFLGYGYIWDVIDPLTTRFAEKIRGIFSSERFFACISIVGCKDVLTEDQYSLYHFGEIDRNVLMCHPVAFKTTSEVTKFELQKKQLELEYYLSIGIKNDPKVSKLIEEVYQ